jgi:hypothetical protein
MTKARDLANAASAFNAVTAGELTYLDNVTSPIQTQINNTLQEAVIANAMDYQ